VVACDSIEGTGLDELRDRLGDVLAAGPANGSDYDRPRLWVDRSFTITGAGTVVTGGVGHGTFVAGDRVLAVGPGGSSAARVRGIQALGHRVDGAPAGTRAALNLAGIDRRAVRRGDAIVRPDEWHLTALAEASLIVLGSVDHDVTQRGAFLAYLGTGEHTVRLRLLGASSLAPGAAGTVRLTWYHALPLVPGDRYVLRETGRGEIVGGGELLELDPVRSRRTSRAARESQPSEAGRSLPPVPREHDWVRADELERRLGVPVEAVVDGWVVSAATLQSARDALVERIDQSRPIGLDVARLDERERAVLTLLERGQAAEIAAGYAVAPGWRDELARHPLVQLLEQHPFSPPAPATAELPPEVLRALVRRGYVIVKDGIYFAAMVRTSAAAILVELSRGRPEGFTLSEARQALGTTRKWAVPLLQLLDESGITVRHGDYRQVRPPRRGDGP
nr:SelB C-terminal domain-containing protein [Pseudonocardiales bacterium]